MKDNLASQALFEGVKMLGIKGVTPEGIMGRIM